jgi:hypothetical protein
VEKVQKCEKWVRNNSICNLMRSHFPGKIFFEKSLFRDFSLTTFFMKTHFSLKKFPWKNVGEIDHCSELPDQGDQIRPLVACLLWAVFYYKSSLHFELPTYILYSTVNIMHSLGQKCVRRLCHKLIWSPGRPDWANFRTMGYCLLWFF